MFASAVNAQRTSQGVRLPFFSRQPQPGAIGVDALRADWTRFRLPYANPPFSLILPVLTLLREQRVRAVLILPVWDSMPWWPLLAEMVIRWNHLPQCEELFLKGGLDPIGAPRWSAMAVLVDGNQRRTVISKR
jgi:hypothetical protein